jgi:hypothetical protein
MGRLVLIHDELRRKYRLVTGDSRVDVVLKQTVARKSSGFGKVVDRTLPDIQQMTLEIGVRAGLLFRIDSYTDVDQWLGEQHKKLLENIFFNGMNLFQSYIENQASRIKAKLLKPNMTALDLNRILVVAFPDILANIQKCLDEAMVYLPFLILELRPTVNLSSQIDQFLEGEYDKRFDVWKSIVVQPLESPYDPHTELEAKREHFERLLEIWPSSTPPTLGDLEEIRLMLNSGSSQFNRRLLVGQLGAKKGILAAFRK